MLIFISVNGQHNFPIWFPQKWDARQELYNCSPKEGKKILLRIPKMGTSIKKKKKKGNACVKGVVSSGNALNYIIHKH